MYLHIMDITGCQNSLVTNILQNSFIFVPRMKLYKKQHEHVYGWTSLWLNYTFK